MATPAMTDENDAAVREAALREAAKAVTEWKGEHGVRYDGSGGFKRYRQGVRSMILALIGEPRRVRAADPRWKRIATAPKDRTILVWYDHDADPYVEDEATGKLTDYAAWCESGYCLKGKGFCAARWCDEVRDSMGGYDEGYDMPGWWFVEDGDYECAVNPTHWMGITSPETAA